MCCCGSSLAIAQAIAQAKLEAAPAVHDPDQGQVGATPVALNEQAPSPAWRMLAYLFGLDRANDDKT